MPVKKGKGLIQERENLKQQITEKNAQIETLMADFQKQESALGDFRDHLGQYLNKSNTILQEIIETIDGTNINLPIDVNEPVEKECLQAPTVPPASFDNDWNTGITDDEFNAEDAVSIGSYVGNTLSNLNKKNQIVADQFASFSTLFDDMIASLLKKLLVKSKEVIEQHLSAKENMSTRIEELQGELENDAFQRRVIELENELEASGNTCNEMSSKLENYQAKEDTWNESKRQVVCSEYFVY
nr:hypothetical protein [Tanacetum cinerariifolium]